MDNYLKVLKRVGRVLIAFGLLDIGFMIYCITRGQSYSSSFNIFAVIAGVFLFRGHLGAARVVTSFSAFMLTGFVGAVLVLFPFLQPFDLWITQVRLHPVSSLLYVGVASGVIALLLWVYTQLRSPAVVQARTAAGQSASPPKAAFLFGVLLVLGLSVALHFTLHGEAAANAMRLAKAKEGSAYKYCVTSMSWAGDHGRAAVTAYNDRQIKSVDVEW